MAAGRSSTRKAAAALALLLAAAMPSSGSGAMAKEPATAGNEGQGLEIVHWWVTGGEKRAVRILETEFNRRSSVPWLDRPMASGAEAFTTIFARTRGGNPPGAAQFNVSRQFDQLIAEDRLLDLTDLARKQGWRKFIRPAKALDVCERDGRIWCVPLNIHSWQWGWASIPAFAKAGMPVPDTLGELITMAPALRKAGITPLALGGEPWQQYGLFGVILLNQAGKDVHYALFRDRNPAVAKSPQVAAVFETFRQLGKLADKRAKGRSWNKATAMVVQDKAAMLIMADWAKSEFLAAGKVPGKDFACIPGPSANPLFQLGGDVFIFPRQQDPALEAAQLELASMLLSREIQVSFNIAKGSLPVRGDVDLSSADECMRKGLEILKRPEAVVETNELFLSGETVFRIQSLLDKFLWNDRMTVAAAQAELARILSAQR